MKSQLLMLSKITLASMFIVGCGGGSDTPKDTTVYDLGQYVVPSESQTNVYQETTYEKEAGVQTYTETGQDISNERYDVNGSLITITIGSEMSETVAIEEDRIIRTFINEDANVTMESNRTAMVGDTVADTIIAFKEDDLELDINLVCKLSNHLDEMDVGVETYKDVLFVDCIQSSQEKSVTVNGLNITVNASGTAKSYFAKDVGLISYADELCVDAEFNGVSTRHCYKNESNLITTVK